MSQSDFIPRPDAAFNTFLLNLFNYASGQKGTWGHLGGDDLTALQSEIKAWTLIYEQTLVPHIPQITQEKNRVRVTTERALRAFINRFLRWPPVSDFDRDKMGIRNWDTIRTPQPVPSTVPEIETNSSTIRILSQRIREHGSQNWAKPDHVHSIELAWGIKDARPTHVGELPHLETITANPVELHFEEEERGKRVFFAARFLNNTAQPGPWSDIESAFVP